MFENSAENQEPKFLIQEPKNKGPNPGLPEEQQTARIADVGASQVIRADEVKLVNIGPEVERIVGGPPL